MPIKLQLKLFYKHNKHFKSLCYDRLEDFEIDKITTSTLAKKIQYTFAYNQYKLSRLFWNKKIVLAAHILIVWVVIFLCLHLFFIVTFKCMEKIYKRRYYLTQYTKEINLFEILELLVINYLIFKVYALVKQIKIVKVYSHFKPFEVN